MIMQDLQKARHKTRHAEYGTLVRRAMNPRLCAEDFRPECVRSCDENRGAAYCSLARPACSQCAQLPCGSRNATSDGGSNMSGSSRLPVRWVHLPKTGTTFIISVVNYACEHHLASWHLVYMAKARGQADVRIAHALNARKETSDQEARCAGQLLLPIAGHVPVGARETRLVTIFRRPAQRLISAYLDNYHAWGLPPEDRNEMKRTARTVDAWARYPGVAGCMGKMLIGRNCGARLHRHQLARIQQRAISVLRSDRFAFVGLVEHWDLSVCLFHAMMGGGSSPLGAEFRHLGHSANSRGKLRAQTREWRRASGPTAAECRLRNANGTCFDMNRGPWGYNESVLGGFVDELDEAVYAEAQSIFARNLAMMKSALPPPLSNFNYESAPR